jgi:peroxiredoxin
MFIKLKTGSKAPEFNFVTPWNSLSSFYKTTGNNPAILIFLRYIGCPVCQTEMANIKRNIHLANKKKAIVLVVLQSLPDAVAAVTSKKDWPFTIVCDPHAKIFKLYSVESGNIFKYLHPAGIAATIKAIITGNKHGKFEGIETQLPASFVITSDKLIKYAYYGKRINDVPPLETLALNID